MENLGDKLSPPAIRLANGEARWKPLGVESNGRRDLGSAGNVVTAVRCLQLMCMDALALIGWITS